MRKFICTVLAALLSLWGVDRLGGLVMWWVNRNSNDVIAPKLQYIEKGIHEEVVLIGASRCHHHYVPQIITDTLGMTVYNAGVGGADNIFSHYVVLCHVLARHIPKVICLEVMLTDYNVQHAPFSALKFFAPLFGINEEADSVFQLAGLYWKYQFSHLYRYNAKASSNLWGLVLNRKKNGDHGYIPLPPPPLFPGKAELEMGHTESDSLKIEYLSRFIRKCQQYNIQLILTVSPKYTRVKQERYEILKQLAQIHNIPFLDYHTTGLFLDHPEYFKDTMHLWDDGARRFSAIFAADLSAIIN